MKYLLILVVTIALYLGGCTDLTNGGLCSYVTPLDRAIIKAGCRATRAFTDKVLDDMDCPTYIRDQMRLQSLKATALEAWVGGDKFPESAEEDAGN